MRGGAPRGEARCANIDVFPDDEGLCGEVEVGTTSAVEVVDRSKHIDHQPQPLRLRRRVAALAAGAEVLRERLGPATLKGVAADPTGQPEGADVAAQRVRRVRVVAKPRVLQRLVEPHVMVGLLKDERVGRQVERRLQPRAVAARRRGDEERYSRTPGPKH